MLITCFEFLNFQDNNIAFLFLLLIFTHVEIFNIRKAYRVTCYVCVPFFNWVCVLTGVQMNASWKGFLENLQSGNDLKCQRLTSGNFYWSTLGTCSGYYSEPSSDFQWENLHCLVTQGTIPWMLLGRNLNWLTLGEVLENLLPLRNFLRLPQVTSTNATIQSAVDLWKNYWQGLVLIFTVPYSFASVGVAKAALMTSFPAPGCLATQRIEWPEGCRGISVARCCESGGTFPVHNFSK